MAFWVIRHKVEDFEKWKPAFDGDADNRKAHGSKGGYLLRNADDPNEVAIVLEWDSIQGMRQFSQSPKLKEAMRVGGVMDTPDLYMCDLVKKVAA